MALNNKEANVLRELAKQYAQVASLPVHMEKVEMWKALNRGEMKRPMVTIDQLPWHELELEDELTLRIEQPYFREVERQLRQTLYKWNHIPVDMVVEPFITIPRVIENSEYGLKIEEDTARTSEESHVLSHAYKNQFTEPEDIGKIQDLSFSYDRELTREYFDEATELLGDIMPIRQAGFGFHLGIWDVLSQLMSVGDIYYDLVTRPEFLHELVERMTTATLSGIDEANALEIHDDIANTCHCSYTYTDELLPSPGESKGPLSENCWAFGLAQLFTSVSPETTREFELEYFKRLAKPFGMIYYGCCERLDDRLEAILEIPNIRKVSCSPWSKKDAFAEKIGRSVVMSNKPNPAFLAVGGSMDMDVVTSDLRETCDAARRYGANLELILKDVSTVGGNPQKLFDWARVAMEIVQD